ncbi:CAP domain-containing protein [Streptomyces sp. MS06]|uniref:CAP domain-containing protein n=1 Tax=Streptomyces sp. MS06 TaxID=3385974 RepID=UPI0039A1B931
MGRHRRSAAGRAATDPVPGGGRPDVSHEGSRSGFEQDPYGASADGRAPRNPYGSGRATMGIAPYLQPEAYAEARARSEEYLFATGASNAGDTAVLASDRFDSPGFTPDAGAQRAGHRRRVKKAAVPVRSGLLGVSAAVALGTVAVASGVVPGLENYRLGGDHSSGGDSVQAAGTPSNSPSEQGGASGAVDGRAQDQTSTSRDSRPSVQPSASRSATAPSAAPTQTPSAQPSEKPTETAAPSGKPQPTPSAAKPSAQPTTPAAPERATASARATAPAALSAQAQAEAEVLKLVNEERAKVGCSALSANSALTGLARAFSDDMAARGFFDHTDPDGATPWDRAAKASITGLGGENIARGQADAAAVMEAWMNSPGHRANILNCDFHTLGVGVHFGPGGPWWTQDFGY